MDQLQKIIAAMIDAELIRILLPDCGTLPVKAGSPAELGRIREYLSPRDRLLVHWILEIES